MPHNASLTYSAQLSTETPWDQLTWYPLQEDLLRIQDNTRKNLEAEIASYKSEAARQAQALLSLERERDATAGRAMEIGTKLGQMQEVEQIRDAEIADLQKKVIRYLTCHGFLVKPI